MFKFLKYRFLEWKWERILKNSGQRTWTNYFYHNDPDFNARGQTVGEQLVGYPYIAIVNRSNLETRFEPMWGPIEHCSSIINWCNANCRRKYRAHWERVIKDHYDQYTPNGIGGTDELVFGFKNERDFIMFTLKFV